MFGRIKERLCTGKKLAKKQPKTLSYEELGQRVLFSADIMPGLDTLGFEERVVVENVVGDIQLAQEAAPLMFEQAAVEARRELVIVNENVSDYQQLTADLRDSNSRRLIEVVVLEADRDGIEQVSEILADRTDLAAVHFITHGAGGQINLGNSWLNSNSLQQNSQAVGGWGSSLTEKGDFLFYGCNIAADISGQVLLNDISRLTGADVAASDDVTGNAQSGGDWVLEYDKGNIETALAINSEIQQNWNGVLATFTVNTTLDTVDSSPGDGVAKDFLGNTSLRAAIMEANAFAGTDTINFDITGAGPHTISINSSGQGELPQISSRVTIDGTSEPDYTNKPVIEIDGSLTSNADGLTLASGSDGSTIRGLSITGFTASGPDGNAIDIRSDNNIIVGNFIGLAPDGDTADENLVGVNLQNGASGNVIGGSNAADRNVIGDSIYAGVILHTNNTDNNRVIGNYIGLNSDGDTVITSGTFGVIAWDQAADNIVGGINPGEGNRIAGHREGVVVDNTAGNTTILGNEIFENREMGIDINNDQETYNDVGDSDSGPNDLLNYPVITDVQQSGPDLDITFSLDLPAGDYRIEFFENPLGLDDTGYGEGEIFLGAVDLTSSGIGSETFGETLVGVTATNATTVVATATEKLGGSVFGSTSEFSAPAATDATLLDQFTAPDAYNGSNGTVDWSSNAWQEITEADGPTSGNVMIQTRLGAQGLNITNGGLFTGAWRGADLSGATTAILSFDCALITVEAFEFVVLEISDNGGRSWAELDRFEGPANDGSLIPVSYDITQYASSNTQIRFREFIFNGNDEFHVDNVQIAYNIANNPGKVTIDNMIPAQGDTLTASVTDPDGATGAISYQWYRGGVAIGGATSSTYTTVQADVGAAITVTASYTDDLGAGESPTSTLTAAVTNVNDAPTITTVTGAPMVDEDAVYSLDLTFTDPDDSTVTWTVNWGDGQISSAPSTGATTTLTHTYTQPGFTYNILVSANDGDVTVLQNELLVPTYAAGADSIFRYEETTGAFLQEFATADGLDDAIQVVIGPDGNLYVTGEKSDNVLRYNAVTGAFIDEFVSAGSGGLNEPGGLAFGPDGNLYVSSFATDEVLRYDGTSGAFIDAFVTAGSGGLNEPYNLTFDSDGNLYVNSYWDSQVLRYNGTTGAFIDVFVSSGSGGLSTPEQMIFGPDGNLYIASYDTNEVLRYNGATGAFIDAFVTAGLGGLDEPTGLAFGPDGNLYVADYKDAVILRYNGTTGAFIDEYVSAGSGGLVKPVFFCFLPEQQVLVNPVNDAPVLAGTPTNPTATESGTGTNQVSLIQTGTGGATDVDAADFAGGTLTVSLDTYQAGDRLSVSGSPTGVGSVSGGAGADLVITLDAGATPAALGAILEALQYENTGDDPTAGSSDTDRVYSIILNDGGNSPAPALDSNTLTGTITVIGANDAATATNLNADQTYIEDTALDLTDIVVSDVDSATVTVKLTLSDIAAGSLSTGTSGAVSSTYNSGTGEWTASGAIANINVLLAGVTFNPASNYNSNFNIATSVDDGVAPAVTGLKNMTGTPVNDAPTTTPVVLTAIAEDSGARTITQTELLSNAGDTENDGLTATGLAISAGSGTLSDNGDGTWDYTPAADDDTSVSFSYSITDGASNVAASATLDITPVNDAPTTTPVVLTAIAEDSGAQTITQTELLSNAGDTENDGLTATGLAISAGSGTLSDNGDGTWDYTPAADDDTSVSFSYSITDGASNVAASATLDITPVNDAPTVALTNTTVTISEGADTTLRTKVADINVTDDVLGTNMLSLRGVDANMFEIDSNVLYLMAGAGLDHETKGQLDVTVEVNDAALVPYPNDTDGLSITVTDVNDAPVLGNNSLSISEGATVIFDSNILSATDADNPASGLTFNVSAVNGGQFERVSTGLAITTFTQADIAAKDVRFVHDGSESAPSYDVSVTDGSATAGPVAAAINFTNVNDAPVLGNNSLTISEGATVTIDSSMLTATDIDHPDPSLTFNVSGVTAGHFAFSSDTATPITSFDQSDIAAGNVVFLHDGSQTQPGYSISVTDGADSSATITANITFTNRTDSLLPDIDYLTLPESNPESPESSAKPATDEVTPGPPATAREPGVSAGQLTVSSDAVTSISGLDQADISAGTVVFVQDNPSSQTAAITDFRRVEFGRNNDISSSSRTFFSYQRLKLLLEAHDFGELKTALGNMKLTTLSSADYDLVRSSLDAIKEEIGKEILLGRTVVGSAIAASIGLSVGYVVWLLKGGSLLASVLSSLPAWQLADPLAILVGKNGDDDEDEDDESLETIIDEGSKRDEDKKATASGLDNVKKEWVKQ